MTSQVIPDEAVEAAAGAVHNLLFGTDPSTWNNCPNEVRKTCIAEARAALGAAAPHMFAQAIEDAVHAFPLETIHAPDNAVVWMMRRAEELRNP